MRSKFRRTVLTASTGILSLWAGCVGSTDSDDENGTSTDENESDGETAESSGETTDDSNSSGTRTRGWPSFRSGPTNDGFVETNGPKSEPSIRWSVDLPAAIRTTATVHDGTVYAGAGSTLYALEDGESIWTLDLDGPVSGSPAVTDDLIVCPAGEELVVTTRSGDDTRRIDLSDAGSTPSLTSYQAQSRPNYSSPVIVDGTAYVGTSEGSLVAVTLEEGSVEWRITPTADLAFQSQQSAPDSNLSSPAVTDELVVVGTESGVAAFDATDGTNEWNHPTDWPVLSSPAVVDGTVYVDGQVPLALDASSGTVQWRSEDAFPSTQRSERTSSIELLQERSSAVSSSAAVAADLAVVNDTGHRLVALETSSGSSRWETPLDGAEPAFIRSTSTNGGSRTDTPTLSTRQMAPRETSPTIAGDVVLVGTTSGLVAVSLSNGDELWRYETESQISASPVIDDGAVIVGDDDGTLYALE